MVCGRQASPGRRIEMVKNMARVAMYALPPRTLALPNLVSHMSLKQTHAHMNLPFCEAVHRGLANPASQGLKHIAARRLCHSCPAEVSPS